MTQASRWPEAADRAAARRRLLARLKSILRQMATVQLEQN